jgi:hypothetical protein
LPLDIVSQDRSLSTCGAQQAQEHADGGGLARTIGTQETEDFAASDSERYTIDGGEIAEPLRQVDNFDSIMVHHY